MRAGVLLSCPRRELMWLSDVTRSGHVTYILHLNIPLLRSVTQLFRGCSLLVTTHELLIWNILFICCWFEAIWIKYHHCHRATNIKFFDKIGDIININISFNKMNISASKSTTGNEGSGRYKRCKCRFQWILCRPIRPSLVQGYTIQSRNSYAMEK